MRLEIGESVGQIESIRRDLIRGKNPWSGTREIVRSRMRTSRCSAREKVVTQPPSCLSGGVIPERYPIVRDLV